LTRKAVQENFVCHLEANARQFPGKTALVWEKGSLTWSELHRLASGFAHDLSKQGVKPGDRVALVLPNRWDFVVAFMGALKMGATAAPLNPLLKQEELATLLSDLKPKRVVDQVKAEAGTWDTAADTSAPALILYTSGSTGRPKGAVFSHSALTFANRSWGGPVMGLTPEDRVLAALPLAHSLGLNGGLLAPLLFGAAVAMVERFSPEAVFAAAERQRATVFPGVATIFRRLLNSPAFPNADFSSLRLAVSGAAPCPWELSQEWSDRTGTRILRGYGMTELFRPISYYAADPTDIPDAVGRPVPDVAIRVVDNGKATSQGETGELLIKSPAAMDGYLGDSEETRAVLEDGWFKTGDLANVSPEGYVRLVGRKRERILRGGYSIFPQEIEAVLVSHPAVAEAAVVGVPSPDLGEEVAAFVALKPMARITEEELLDHCKGRLARFKYPRRVVILKELPKGKTGKILKSELIKGRS
jgi:long-chain acyl-CoA synthetase